jgi:hypothetical protein
MRVAERNAGFATRRPLGRSPDGPCSDPQVAAWPTGCASTTCPIPLSTRRPSRTGTSRTTPGARSARATLSGTSAMAVAGQAMSDPSSARVAGTPRGSTANRWTYCAQPHRPRAVGVLRREGTSRQHRGDSSLAPDGISNFSKPQTPHQHRRPILDCTRMALLDHGLLVYVGLT